MSESFYNSSDLPTEEEKQAVWGGVQSSLKKPKPAKIIHIHWKSFWVGNAAAVLLIFAAVGIVFTGNSLQNLSNAENSDEQIYETLNSATNQLSDLPPLLIDQATEGRRSSLESTTHAIEEIDLLIEELKTDILINGESPVKRNTLKRLYATKLDFYKDLLLNEELES
ncbi:MAG: hypothetical protein ED557_13945 [Balneola sp.]|nr:MAG: hypothetical protein ED557_13945 [Balneola sp.]